MKLISVFILLFTSNAFAYQGLDVNPNSRPSIQFENFPRVPSAPNYPSEVGFGWEALMYAVSKGRSDIVREILEDSSIDVNAKNVKGVTALMYASSRGYTETVRELLKVPGIDVNAETYRYGWTALMYAASNDHIEVVHEFSKYPEINVNAKNSYNGRTALMSSVWNGHLAVVRELLKVRGIDVNARDLDGWTVLKMAKKYRKDKKMIDLLIAAGAKR